MSIEYGVTRSGRSFKINKDKCPICLEAIIKDKVTTKCGHIYHKDCILKSININKKCPYCRQVVKFEKLISHYEENNINNFKLSKYKFNLNYISSTIIENVTIEDAFEQLINQTPIYFLEQNFDNYYPIYLLKKGLNKFYISYYLRHIILWNKTLLQVPIKRWSDNDIDIYCLNERSFINDIHYNFNVINILYLWIYDVVSILKDTYKFIYHRKLNSLIMDFIGILINTYSLPRYLFQTAAIVSIYHAINIYEDIIIPIDKLIWYTEDSSTLENFNKYSNFLKLIINKYVIRNN